MALARFTFEADGVLIEGEGVVTVVGGPPPDAAGTIAAFLDAVDAVTVEREALYKLDWGGRYDEDAELTSAVIAVLRDIAMGVVRERA